MRNQRDWSGILKSLGPGLLWAGAAIGVSHLVQSTRAGAGYGFSLVWVILLANLLKYPFFEFGPRYASATGESLLEGYRKLGMWAVWVFLGFTVLTMFTISAAVTVVTAGLAGQLTGLSWSPAAMSAVLFALCFLILIIGRYAFLDSLIKIVILVLTLSTLLSVFIAVFRGPAGAPGFEAPPLWNIAGFSFLIALMGWMPSAIDISVWHSLWTIERRKQTGHAPTVRESLFDFNVGYIGTAILSIGFLALGALVMFGTGESFQGSAAGFAGQLIQLYTANLGGWSWLLIGIAAFTTMFSTTLTVVDALPRVMQHATHMLVKRDRAELEKPQDWLYWGWMLVVMAGALIILGFLIKELRTMVDVATTLSFLTAPILGYINYRVVTSRNMPEHARPGRPMRALSYTGMVFLAVFGLIFLLWKFGLRG